MKKTGTYLIIAVTVPVLMFGGILAAQKAGWWQTSNAGRAPIRINRGNFAGMYDPSDIRGSSTLASIEQYYGIPASLIAEAFGLKADSPGSLTAKQVEENFPELTAADGTARDVGTDAVKLFVARMTGLPFEPEADTGIPEYAVELILSLGPGMTDTERADLLGRAVQDQSVSIVTSVLAASQEAEHTAPGSFSFSGKTSFADVLNAGLSKAQIETVLGRPMPPAISLVKDFCDTNGLSYGKVKSSLLSMMNP